MSFYTSLSGLKGAQSDLSTISNNVANVGSTAFKKSRAEFGDIFAAGSAIGQGVRTNVSQPFTQGTLEATDKTLDLRSEEHTSELQSLMRISYAVFYLQK